MVEINSYGSAAANRNEAELVCTGYCALWLRYLTKWSHTCRR